jgi:hypothetical protein
MIKRRIKFIISVFLFVCCAAVAFDAYACGQDYGLHCNTGVVLSEAGYNTGCPSDNHSHTNHCCDFHCCFPFFHDTSVKSNEIPAGKLIINFGRISASDFPSGIKRPPRS